MADTPDLEPWRRLGRALQAQRVELDPRYRTFEVFVRERGTPRDLNYRMLWDIEHGKRANYRGPALRAIEAAYGLPADWITRALAADDALDAALRGPEFADFTPGEIETARRYILLKRAEAAREERENHRRGA